MATYYPNTAAGTSAESFEWNPNYPSCETCQFSSLKIDELLAVLTRVGTGDPKDSGAALILSNLVQGDKHALLCRLHYISRFRGKGFDENVAVYFSQLANKLLVFLSGPRGKRKQLLQHLNNVPSGPAFEKLRKYFDGSASELCECAKKV